MTNTIRRRVLDGVVFAVVALTAFIPVVANPRTAPRDIVLVARDMTFYLEGSDVPNPTIVVKRGEDVRVVVKNEDTGITHAFAIPTLKTSIDRIQPGTTTKLSWRAPAESGRHEYVCLPHAQMMKGVLLVAD